MRATEFLTEEFTVVKVDNGFRLKGPDGKIGDQTFKNRALAQQAAQRATTQLAVQAADNKPANTNASDTETSDTETSNEKRKEARKTKTNRVVRWMRGIGKFTFSGPGWLSVILPGLIGANWAMRLYDYCVGNREVSGYDMSPCDKIAANQPWSPGTDRVIDADLILSNSNEYSFTGELVQIISGAINAAVYGTAATLGGIRLVAMFLTRFPIVGGWAAPLVAIGGLLVSGAAQFAINIMTKDYPIWGPRISRMIAKRLMNALTVKTVEGWCRLDARLDAGGRLFGLGESKDLFEDNNYKPSAEDIDDAKALAEYFQTVLDRAREEIEKADPRKLKMFDRIVKKANAKVEKEISRGGGGGY